MTKTATEILSKLKNKNKVETPKKKVGAKRQQKQAPVKQVLKPAKPAKRPQVYKKTEYEWMLDLIRRGLWRTTNLASAVGVDRETIDKWKKNPEVVEARRKVIWQKLGSQGKGRGVETVLKEMGIETDPDKLEVIHKFEDLKDDELDDRIARKAREVGVAGATTGEGTSPLPVPPKVREAAPEAN